MKLKLDLHDIYNRGTDIDHALREIMDEAVRIKAKTIEIIPGKGSGALRVHRAVDATATATATATAQLGVRSGQTCGGPSSAYP